MNVDPATKFTGGCKIQLINDNGQNCGQGHIAFENQPLSTFVEAVLKQKQVRVSQYSIIDFCEQTCQMKVMILELL